MPVLSHLILVLRMKVKLLDGIHHLIDGTAWCGTLQLWQHYRMPLIHQGKDSWHQEMSLPSAQVFLKAIHNE